MPCVRARAVRGMGTIWYAARQRHLVVRSVRSHSKIRLGIPFPIGTIPTRKLLAYADDTRNFAAKMETGHGNHFFCFSRKFCVEVCRTRNIYGFHWQSGKDGW